MPAKHYSAKDPVRASGVNSPRGVSTRKHTPATHTSAPPPSQRENTQYIRQYRTLNRWSIFFLLLISSLIIVLFVSNTLEVNRLFEEVNTLRQEHRRLVQQNEVLQARSVRLQSPERITTIAREKLGMIHPSTAPEVLK